jgi:hypothetical protein
MSFRLSCIEYVFVGNDCFFNVKNKQVNVIVKLWTIPGRC